MVGKCAVRSRAGCRQCKVAFFSPINSLCPAFWTWCVERESDGLQGHSVRVCGVGMAMRAGLGTGCRWCIALSPQMQGCISVLCPSQYLILQSGAASAGEAGRATLHTVLGSWLGHSAPREFGSHSCTKQNGNDLILAPPPVCAPWAVWGGLH